jgi:transcriptional regulator with XRE-family HTH domain
MSTRTLGSRVRALRIARGMTQFQLAQAAGVRESRISEIERNRCHRPNVPNLPKIAEALGTTVESLTREEPVSVRIAACEPQPMTLHATHVTVVHVADRGRCGSTYADVR